MNPAVISVAQLRLERGLLQPLNSLYLCCCFLDNYKSSAYHNPSAMHFISLNLLNVPSLQKVPHCPLHRHLLSLSLQDCNLQERKVKHLAVGEVTGVGHLFLEVSLHNMSEPWDCLLLLPMLDLKGFKFDIYKTANCFCLCRVTNCIVLCHPQCSHSYFSSE